MNSSLVEGSRGWDRSISFIADVPWGVIAFFTVLILLLTNQLEAADITGLGTAAGLLGVGHGLHLGAKHVSRRSDRHSATERAPS